jgi:hypothetical protein
MNNERFEHKIFKIGFQSLLVIIISFIILLFVGVLGPQIPIIELVTVPAALLGLGAHIGLFIVIVLVLVGLIVVGPSVYPMVRLVMNSIKDLFNQKLNLNTIKNGALNMLSGGSAQFSRSFNQSLRPQSHIISPLIILLLLIFISLGLSVIVQITLIKRKSKRAES